MLSVEIPPRYRAERIYAVGTILEEFLGLDFNICEGAQIAYTVIRGESGMEVRVPDVFFLCSDKEWLSPASLPKRPLLRWDAREQGMETRVSGQHVPLLYPPSDFNGELVVRIGDTLEFKLDIFGAIFFMLARYEEIVQSELQDQHGRFPADASIAYAEEFLDRPIIDEYAELFWTCLNRAFPSLKRKQRRYRVIPTHDLDRPFLFPSIKKYFHGLADYLRSCNGRLAWNWLCEGVGRLKGPEHDPFIQGQSYLLSLSEKFGLRSCLNVMGALPGSKDFGYKLSSPAIHNLVNGALERGHEIGFHPGYKTFCDADAFREEKSRIEDYFEITLTRGRQHYLRARFPETWRIWDDAGFTYDDSVGYAEKNGFRCGVCRSFPVFDIRRRKQLRLKARPLILMDGTLRASFNEGLTEQEGLERGLALMRTCRRYDGEFVLLWHNSSLHGKWQTWTKVYEQILSEAVDAP